MRGHTFRSHLQTSFAKCICTSCEKEDCQLGLDSLSSYSLIIIDADKYREYCNFKGRLCDYMLFYLEGGTTVGVIELKSGLTKVDVAQRQIRNGSKIAAQVIGSHKVSNFLPILLHGRRIKRLDILTLRRAKVPFQGKSHYIIVERCGSQLRRILRQYPAS